MALPPQSRSDKLAQRDAAQQDVFLREVDEAVRQDEMFTLFQRYGKPAIAVVVVGLLALAGYLWWDHSSKQSAGEVGEQFTVALDKLDARNLPAADKELVTVEQKGGDGSAAAAKLLRAGIALEQNKQAEAAKLFAEVAADGDAPQPFRDLATIREVSINFDTLPPQQVLDRLKPLATPGNPWFGNAGELVGIAYMKQNRNDLAGPLFAAISRDKDVPDSLKRRTRQLAGLLGVDAIDDVAKAASGDAPEPAAQ
ncbi:tetratricopeptide repeat protein [Novosphingobium sp. PS1R-30]|uniref:Tetratricopeptide repeat protein n=1 Tax=Novosphingobium anseongense TaxID=3133436 RepID=A0ABU8RZX7_9SPHN